MLKTYKIQMGVYHYNAHKPILAPIWQSLTISKLPTITYGD